MCNGFDNMEQDNALPEERDLATPVHKYYRESEDVWEIKELLIDAPVDGLLTHLSEMYKIGAGLLEAPTEGIITISEINDVRRQNVREIVKHNLTEDQYGILESIFDKGEVTIHAEQNAKAIEVIGIIRKFGGHFEQILSTDELIEKLSEVAHTLGVEAQYESFDRASRNDRLRGEESYGDTESVEMLDDLRYYMVERAINPQSSR